MSLAAAVQLPLVPSLLFGVRQQLRQLNATMLSDTQGLYVTCFVRRCSAASLYGGMCCPPHETNYPAP